MQDEFTVLNLAYAYATTSGVLRKASAKSAKSAAPWKYSCALEDREAVVGAMHLGDLQQVSADGLRSLTAITGQTGLLIQGLEESGEKLWACIAKVSTSTGSQQAGNGIASLAVYFPRTSATGKTAAHASRTCIA